MSKSIWITLIPKQSYQLTLYSIKKTIFMEKINSIWRLQIIGIGFEPFFDHLNKDVKTIKAAQQYTEDVALNLFENQITEIKKEMDVIKARGPTVRERLIKK